MRILRSALVLCAVVAGANQAHPAARPDAAKSPSRKASLTDQQLEAAISQRFAKSKISVNGFQVKVRSGTAFITGRTAIIQHKGTATRLAKAAGARAVDNRVEVDAAARAKAGADLQRARRAKAKRSEPRSDKR